MSTGTGFPPPIVPDDVLDTAEDGMERFYAEDVGHVLEWDRRVDRDRLPLGTYSHWGWRPVHGEIMRKNDYTSLGVDELARLAHFPVIAACAARLSGSDQLRLWHDQLHYKPVVLAEHEAELVPICVKRGQVSFHHCKAIDGSGPNRGKKPRRSFVVHFQPGTNHYVERGHYHPNDDLVRRTVNAEPDYSDPANLTATLPITFPLGLVPSSDRLTRRRVPATHVVGPGLPTKGNRTCEYWWQPLQVQVISDRWSHSLKLCKCRGTKYEWPPRRPLEKLLASQIFI
jgi:hypothetical protein